jgi:hypothetical protein
VTRNLKEAVSKVPTRRTGTAYEAATPGRGGMKIQSPIAIQEGVEVDAAGIWDEGRASYPGRSVKLPCASGIERCYDGLAEVSRSRSSWTNHPTKGRT